MKSLKGNSYYLIVRIIFFLIPPVLIGFIICQPQTPIKTIYIGVFLISIFAFLIVKSLGELVTVEFNEVNIKVTYLIIQKKVSISYSNLFSWTCFDGQRGHHYNTIRFHNDNSSKLRKVKIDRIVNAKDFIPFCKWLKEKNKDLKIIIKPSDSKLLIEYQKEFSLGEKM